MSTSPARADPPGFLTFYREYARSGVHAAAAAGLTLFGLLATYWSGFLVLAIAVYVLPPVYLYVTGDRTGTDSEHDEPDNDGATSEETGDRTHADGDPEASSGATTEPTPTTAESDRGASGGERSAAAANAERENEPATAAETDGEPVDGEPVDDEPTDEFGEAGSRAWATVETPTDEPLYDAVVAGQEVFAVGDNGVVLARREGEWTVALEAGPTTESNPLWGVDATDDDERVWFCGDSGALGFYDVAQGKVTDRSAPRDRTGTWADVAIVGRAGDERIHLVNESGAVLRGRNDDGETHWTELVTPGSGSSLSAVAFLDRETGYCCDTNQGVFCTTDGRSWERIGIDDAGVDFNDLAVARGELLVAGGDGSVFRYDDPGWTKLHVGDETIYSIDRASGGDEGGIDSGLAVGDNGAIYELVGSDWERVESPTDDTLCGVVVAIESPDVAVGDDGTVLERSR